ncbi:MAG: type II secretion system F family protein [Candidatus Pseudomonas phytovorans]|uniref:Type II secretion system F family protein n=1 Tax=Candidatus Pseudomonas phytovorans TaxID=3121377 RepID=A0AAJ5WES9_9PSED|nr:type II secretion system F family protein [Pseudomonas sp.]WEK29041.1 MAG: type II secretion system F family protein [Pseudomonas sp.]
MDAVLDLFTLVVFLCVLLAVYAARSLSGKHQRALAQAERMAALKASMGSNALDIAGEDGLLRDANAPAFTRWPVLGNALGRLWTDLATLGWRDSLRTRLGMLLLASVMFAVLLGRETPAPWLYGSLLAVLAFGITGLVLYRQAMGKYLQQLKLDLPQAIDAITRAARAGVPVSNAFSMVAQNLSGPLAREFVQIDNWLRLGLPLRQVMQESANRVPLNEYRFFAVILIINMEAGGRLGETLDRLSATLRERQELFLKIQAKTSEARASAKIVGALVPCALGYMYFNSPKDFRFLLNDPTGNSVLFYAFGSVALGLLITHLMVRRIG